MLDISGLDPPPAGFGKCGRCAYRDVSRAVRASGGAEPWAVCYACASREMEKLASDRCDICGQELVDSKCPNYVCEWPSRGFSWVRPIAKRTGTLERAINRYKYQGATGWAMIFGRVLLGFLDAHEAEFRSFDLIVPSPTFTGEGGRPFDHTWEVLSAASIESFGAWPFTSGVIIKTAATTPFVGKTWRQRRDIAEGELREALEVPDASMARGKRALVYDDVFTDGFTIREVARALRRAGAIEVCEVVLARQPRRG
jgi:predicted amidophosphoribosyltransferase